MVLGLFPQAADYSHIVATFSYFSRKAMIKSKFGGIVRSKVETACTNEILLKVLCHNICVLISEMFELGIKPEFLTSNSIKPD